MNFKYLSSPPHVPPGCTFETIRKQNLVQHQLTHSKQKPHQCEVCGKSFSLVKNMRRHALQHDFSALRHMCRVDGCDFETLRSDKFVEHMKKHHSNLAAAPGKLDEAASNSSKEAATPNSEASSSEAMEVVAAAPLAILPSGPVAAVLSSPPSAASSVASSEAPAANPSPVVVAPAVVPQQQQHSSNRPQALEMRQPVRTAELAKSESQGETDRVLI